ncbi:MAG: tail fiber domain-containing protein [Paraclostridium sp.]
MGDIFNKFNEHYNGKQFIEKPDPFIAMNTYDELGEIRKRTGIAIRDIDQRMDDFIGEINTTVDAGKIDITNHTNAEIVRITKHTDGKIVEITNHTNTKKNEITDLTTAKKTEITNLTNTSKNEISTLTTNSKKEISDLRDSSIVDITNHTNTKKTEIINHTETKKTEITNHTNAKKVELDNYEKTKETQLNEYTNAKQVQLDQYEKAKEGELNTFTDTKKAEITSHTSSKITEITNHTNTKKNEITDHTSENKIELDLYEKAKESEIDIYVSGKNVEITNHTNTCKTNITNHTEANKTEITNHTNTEKTNITKHTENKKIEINEHTTLKENEIDIFVVEKNKEIDAYNVVKKGDINEYTDVKKGEINSHKNNCITEINSVKNVSISDVETFTDSMIIDVANIANLKKSEISDLSNIKVETINGLTVEKIKEITDTTDICKNNITTHTDEEIGRLNASGLISKMDKAGGTFTGKVIHEDNVEITHGGKNFIAPNNYGYCGRTTEGVAAYLLYMSSLNDIVLGHDNRKIILNNDHIYIKGGHRIYSEYFKPSKTDVGLSNVDNTADNTKNVLSAKKLTSPVTINGVSFDGSSNITINANPTSHDHNSVYYTKVELDKSLAAKASIQYVDTKISDVVGAAPDALNTLLELSEALGNDPNFSTTIMNKIGEKADKSTQVLAGKGVTGGGSISSNVTINVVSGNDGIIVNDDNISLNAYNGVDSTSTTRPASANAVKLAYDKANSKLDAGANAVSSSKLATPRSINGTNFDGTGNITTANWGTARNLQIGNTAKSVNGGANVTWSTREIGALPLNTSTGCPAPANYMTSSDSTTRTKIRLPFKTNAGKMVVFTIRVYQSYNHYDIKISGYLYATQNQWHAPNAYMMSGSGSMEIKIGRDNDGYAYVSIPAGSYRGVAVIDVVGGYSSADWSTGWVISETNDTPNVAYTATVHPPYSPNWKPTSADVGLGNVNNWGASSSIGANSTSQYATTNMVAQVRAEKANSSHTHPYMSDGGTYGTIKLNNWIRTLGNTGLYFESYGGGWYMTDTTWIRSYNNKPIHVAGNDITCTNNIIAYYSDERLKKNFTKVDNALNMIMSISPYYYEQNDFAKELGYNEDGKVQIGFKAQEMEKILPQVIQIAPVNHRNDLSKESLDKIGNDPIKTIDYGKITPLLWKAIQELTEKVNELENKIKGDIDDNK